MNGQPRVSLSGRKALLIGAAAAGAMALAGCVSPSGRAIFAEVPVNETSPAAAQIEAVLAKPGGYPTFADIPAPPADLPTAEAVRAELQEQEAEGLYTANSAAPDTWHLDATEAFAERALAEANAGGIRPPTDAEIAESEAFAAAARARAKPPPRPK